MQILADLDVGPLRLLTNNRKREGLEALRPGRCWSALPLHTEPTPGTCATSRPSNAGWATCWNLERTRKPERARPVSSSDLPHVMASQPRHRRRGLIACSGSGAAGRRVPRPPRSERPSSRAVPNDADEVLAHRMAEADAAGCHLASHCAGRGDGEVDVEARRLDAHLGARSLEQQPVAGALAIRDVEADHHPARRKLVGGDLLGKTQSTMPAS